MTISPLAARMAAPASGTSAEAPPGNGFTALLGRHLGDAQGGVFPGQVSGSSAQAQVPLVAVLDGLVSAPVDGSAGASEQDPAERAGAGSTADAGADEGPDDPARGTELVAATGLGGALAGLLGNARPAGTQPGAGGVAGVASSDLAAAAPSRGSATPGEATTSAARPADDADVLAGATSATRTTDSSQPGLHEAGAGAPGRAAGAPGDLTNGSSAGPVDVLAGAIHGAESKHAVTLSGGQPTVSAGRANPVTDQVLAQVTRLVSRGDGTHRLTLRLHPADLGEVKVVLTVRDSTVDITLAAGARAREALHEGSPQLRALLEMTGATTGHVVIRDLSTGAVTLASSTSGHQHNGGNGGNGAGQQGTAEHPGSAGAGLGGHTGDRTGDGPSDHADGSYGGEARGHGIVTPGTARPPVGAGTDPTRRSGPPAPSRLDLNL